MDGFKAKAQWKDLRNISIKPNMGVDPLIAGLTKYIKKILFYSKIFKKNLCFFCKKIQVFIK